MLKVGNTLSAEFAEVEEAAKVYQRIMTDIETKADGSEKDVNLKRHGLGAPHSKDDEAPPNHLESLLRNVGVDARAQAVRSARLQRHGT